MTELIQGTSFVLIPCDLIGGMIMAMILIFYNFSNILF